MKVILNLDLGPKFTEGKYVEITESINSLKKNGQEIKLSAQELAIVTHSYLEVGDYVRTLVFGKRFLGEITKTELHENRTNAEMVLWDLTTVLQHQKKNVSLYKYSILYKLCGFHNLKMQSMQLFLEKKIINSVIKVFNIGCIGIMTITFILKPEYKSSLGYSLFLILFFIHAIAFYYKNNIMVSIYSQVLRKSVLWQLQLKYHKLVG